MLNPRFKEDFTVQPHVNQDTAKTTDTGMLDMGRGGGNAAHLLVIKPGGQTARELQDMRRNMGAGTLTPTDPAALEAQLEAAMSKKASGKRRKQPQSPVAPMPVHQNVNVTVTVKGLGSVPSQYHHAYTGDDTVVLGLTALSYIPAVAEAQVELSIRPGELYVNAGYDFVDAQGVRNIIMIKVPQE